MRLARERCCAGKGRKAAAVVDPVASAKAARLHYVNDHDPGIRRVRAGKGFRYVRPDRRPVRDRGDLRRIKALAIPPAWTDVWICPDPDGHIQATGKDDRGRKQYRYHPRWRQVRDEAKYERTIAFGLALPGIRKRTEKDLARPGLPREKVLAAVVRLLETTLIRVGNEEYARENGSFGLTTMRDRHARIEGGTVAFSFRGKSGVRHTVELNDRRLAHIVKRCQDVPGQELFQYVDENGEHHTIDSADVSDYLRRVAGQEFTAKDFRTWAGTVLAARALQEFAAFDTKAEAKRNVVEAIERVAKRLGNTKTICRKCYVHPAVIEAYLDGSLAQGLSRRVEEELTESLSELPPEEAAVLAFLQERLKREAAPAGRNGQARRTG
jgi:DNA topoisomerase-1